MLFDFDYMIESIPQILTGVPTSIAIATVSIFFGLIVGFLIAIIRIYKISFLDKLSIIYVSFFRGTPLLVQVFLCYYGIPMLLYSCNKFYGTNFSVSEIPTFIFICTSFTLNLGAYFSETIRGAIISVPKGQIEAAYSIGMTTYQAFKRVILPQAFRYALPSFGNTCISVLKDTSLAFVASVPEIMGQAKIIAGRTSKFFEVYIVAAIVYWALCIILERGLVMLEKSTTKHERRDTFVKN